jgi:putative ABC transport system permease protein
MTVVGVVATVRHGRLDETPDPQFYLPFAQAPTHSSYLVVRASLPPEALAARVRREIAALDPALPLFEVQTMAAAVDRSLSTRRLTSLLLGAFGAIALLLAAVGIYGVISVTAGGRAREFGVRVALGARGADVGRLVLRRGLALAATGAAAGLAGALAVGRLLRGLLFEVRPVDVVTLGAVAALLAATALLACYLPARRATRADPMVTLRTE